MEQQVIEAIIKVASYQNEGHRHADALNVLNLALEADPKSQKLHVARGVTQMHFKEWQKAKEDLATAKQLGETFPELECHLGEAELLSGDVRTGVERLLKVVKDTRIEGKPIAEQPAVHRRAGFVLASFQKITQGLMKPSTSSPS